MALTFVGGGSNNVNFGSAAALDNMTTWTALVWVRPTSFTDNAYLVSKYRGVTKSGWSLVLRGTGGTVEVDHERATTALTYPTTTTLTSGAWACAAVTFDRNGAAGNIAHIYLGSLAAALAEASYGTKADGTGAFGDDSAQNLVAGNNTPTNLAFPGDIAVLLVWNRVLTLGEMVDQQFNPHPTSGCQVYTHLGYNGTGTQPDWSGNGNAGTVTGAVAANKHVPLRSPFGRSQDWAPYAVSGGTTFTSTVSATQAQALKLVKQVGLPRAVTQAQTATLLKSAGLSRSATQAQSASLSFAKTVLKTVTATQAQAVALAKSVGIGRAVIQTQAATRGALGVALARTVAQPQALSIRQIIGLARSIGQAQTAGLGKAVNLARTIAQALAATVASVLIPVGSRRDWIWTIGPPGSRWDIGSVDGRWTIGTPAGRWTIGPPQE